jgi:hypothetical protein
VLPPEFSVNGPQVNDESKPAGLSVNPAVCEAPFKVAVKTTDWPLETVPAVTVTEAEVAPAAIVTEAGETKRLLLLLKLTVVPPVGASCESVSTQLVAPPELSVVVAQANEESAPRGVSVKLAVCELPFMLAVTTAICTSAVVPAVSVSDAELAPAATVSDAGAANRLLLLLRLTVAPPAAAGCESVTVQVELPPELRAVALHANEDSEAAGVSVKLAACEVPFRLAVRTAVCAAVTEPTVNERDAVVAPAATVTELGDTSTLLLLLRLTTVALSADCESVTMQVAAPPEVSEPGRHASEAKVGVVDWIVCVPTPPGLNVNPLLSELPFKLAVNVALCELAMVPAVTLNVAELAPAGTVADAGVPSSPLLLLRPTTAPPAAAACASPTEQVLFPDELSEVGLQVSEARVLRTRTVPPVAESATAFAAAEAANAPVTPMFRLAAFDARVNCAVATTPLPSTLSFGPAAMHVYVPAPAAQLRVLDINVRFEAAVIVTAVTLPVGYVKVHCNPAIWFVLDGSLKVRFSATVPPATPEPDANDKVVCAQHVERSRDRGTAHLRNFGSRCGILQIPVLTFRKIDASSCLATRTTRGISPLHSHLSASECDFIRKFSLLSEVTLSGHLLGIKLKLKGLR